MCVYIYIYIHTYTHIMGGGRSRVAAGGLRVLRRPLGAHVVEPPVM